MKTSRAVTIITLVSIILSLVPSCGAKSTLDSTDLGSANSSETETKPLDIIYDYPVLDCKGETFTFLNSTTTWGFYTAIDFETLTGDTLDDTVFNRNRFIEEKFNLNFKVIEEDIDSVCEGSNPSSPAK